MHIWSRLTPSTNPFVYKTYFSIKKIEPMSVDCIEAVKTIKEIPVLLIHSKHDHIIPYTETLKIYEHCKDISKIKLWITENKGHTYTHIELKEEYLHKITEFLEENNL